MEGFESIGFLKWIFRRIKPLIIVQIIALCLSVFFSTPYFMPREYKSYAIVYPSNMSDYSHESPSEQMIEFLNSVDIKNEVIAKFHLSQHYNIVDDGRPYIDKLYSQYDHNVIVSPTEYGAVEIKVYDTSPDTALALVKGILDILNKKVFEVQKEKSMEVVSMWTQTLAAKKHQIDSMSALSKQLSTQYGMLEYESQSREVSRAYYQALATAKGTKQFDELTQQIKNLEDHGIEFRVLNQHIESAMGDYTGMEAKYEDALKDINKHFTFWNLVSTPFKPDSYSYPLRSLIILGSCFAALVFSIIVVRVTEKLKPVRMNPDPGGTGRHPDGQ
ncbi:MAG TPA: Wzz/FepE/Etk N-terminal domain-containing protein [Bacteroidia bacterium]|nr:Wzz/FepE/Etk N-terminal domain-containing protein [Bacteroidia bacterium]